MEKNYKPIQNKSITYLKKIKLTIVQHLIYFSIIVNKRMIDFSYKKFTSPAAMNFWAEMTYAPLSAKGF